MSIGCRVILPVTFQQVHAAPHTEGTAEADYDTLKETKAFVYKDNVVLVLMGLLFGCGVGVGLASVIIRIIEIGARRYVRLPDPLACVYSCVMVAVFATIVNIIALRRINHLNLTNVNAN